MIFGLLVSSTVARQLITKFGTWRMHLVVGVPAAATSTLAFFRGRSGAIGVSAVPAAPFVKEKPLSTLPGDERRAREEAAPP